MPESSLPLGANAKGALVATTEALASQRSLLQQLGGRGPRPVKNREAFFYCVGKGLQRYFDRHDRLFGGVIHLTVGVREGQVGGIIKSEEMLHYSGFTLDRVRDILKYILPRFVPRTEVQLIADAVIEELRMGRDEPSMKRIGRPKGRKEANHE